MTIDLKGLDRENQECVVDDRIETADTSNSKKPAKGYASAKNSRSVTNTTTKAPNKKLVSRTSSRAAKYMPKATLWPVSQEKVLLDTLREKSIDAMKKSTAIHELLTNNDTDYSAISESLFKDKLFKSGNKLIIIVYSGDESKFSDNE